MREIGILFSTPMVQAYMLDLKTQTRRLRGLDEINQGPDQWYFLRMEWRSGDFFAIFKKAFGGSVTCSVKSPYGGPGDLLWMRETWTQNGLGYYRYKADWPEGKGLFINPSVPEKFRGRWKPSIHMPKAACRNRMTVVDIYPERLRDISERDAKAEGVELQLSSHLWKNYRPGTEPKEGFSSPFSSYETLWRQINGGESWNCNLWAWRIEFKKI